VVSFRYPPATKKITPISSCDVIQAFDQPFLAHCCKLMLIANNEQAWLGQNVLQEMVASAFAAR
jgi:hypothetical protein